MSFSHKVLYSLQKCKRELQHTEFRALDRTKLGSHNTIKHYVKPSTLCFISLYKTETSGCHNKIVPNRDIK